MTVEDLEWGEGWLSSPAGIMHARYGEPATHLRAWVWSTDDRCIIEAFGQGDSYFSLTVPQLQFVVLAALTPREVGEWLLRRGEG